MVFLNDQPYVGEHCWWEVTTIEVLFVVSLCVLVKDVKVCARNQYLVCEAKGKHNTCDIWLRLIQICWNHRSRNQITEQKKQSVWVRWVQHIQCQECLQAPTHRKWGANAHTKICSPPPKRASSTSHVFHFFTCVPMFYWNFVKTVPIFRSLTKSTDHRTKPSKKTVDLSGVWLCGAPFRTAENPIISSCPKWWFLLVVWRFSI